MTQLHKKIAKDGYFLISLPDVSKDPRNEVRSSVNVLIPTNVIGSKRALEIIQSEDNYGVNTATNTAAVFGSFYSEILDCLAQSKKPIIELVSSPEDSKMAIAQNALALSQQFPEAVIKNKNNIYAWGGALFDQNLPEKPQPVRWDDNENHKGMTAEMKKILARPLPGKHYREVVAHNGQAYSDLVFASQRRSAMTV